MAEIYDQDGLDEELAGLTVSNNAPVWKGGVRVLPALVATVDGLRYKTNTGALHYEDSGVRIFYYIEGDAMPCGNRFISYYNLGEVIAGVVGAPEDES